MALNIRNTEAEQLAAEVARITGETKTAAVATALRDRLARLRRDRDSLSLAERLLRIGRECAALPVRDGRSEADILGYDQDGLPG